MKKIISVLLSIIVVCSFVGCGNNSSSKTTTSSNLSSNSSSTTTSQSSSSSSSSSTSKSSTFTNKYGTSTTKCVKSGCDNYIASSGDTNCCTKHSNNCLNCNCYIDGDAMYCMSCLSSSSSNKSNSSSKSSSTNKSSSYGSSSSSSSSKSSDSCKYELANGSVCGAKCNKYKNLCDKHFDELNSIYQSFVG